MSTQFKPPGKEAMKSKTITSICMLAIIISLYATCYMLFFRTVDVDLTKDISIVYDGESGSASVKVFNSITDYNQRKQEFMDSVAYKVSPKKNLQNGDTLLISSTYDEDLADQYHIHPIHTIRKITVENLPERLSSVDELQPAFLKEINQRGTSYLKKNMEQILNEDFTDFYINSKPELQEQKLMYRIFMDANKKSNKDRILDIYAITAKGQVNVSAKGEKLEEKESTIYYMITYNEINTSFMLREENIYGEKLIYSGTKDLTNQKVFEKVIQNKYGKQFHITFLDLPVYTDDK